MAEAETRRWGIGGVAGGVLGCALLFLFFCVVRFPYASFRVPLESQLSAVTGASVAIGELDGHPSLGVVALRARTVRVAFSDGRSVDLEHLTVRPAWSLSWLRGRPALALDAGGALGSIDGTLWPDAEAPGFSGSLAAVSLDALPALLRQAELPVTGVLDADVDLRREAGELDGRVRFEARDGSLAPPGVSLGIPFATLQGRLAFAPGDGTRVEGLELEGPMVSASLRGHVGHAPVLERAPLDLEIEVRRIDPALQALLEQLGVQGSAAGTTLKLGGTVGEPAAL